VDEQPDPPAQEAATSCTAGALLLVACNGLAYVVSLASIRGGSTFPALLIGAASGIAMSHLPGLALVAGAAHGHRRDVLAHADLPADLGPLLATLLLGSDGLAVTPLVTAAQKPSPPATAGAGGSPRCGRCLVGWFRQDEW